MDGSRDEGLSSSSSLSSSCSSSLSSSLSDPCSEVPLTIRLLLLGDFVMFSKFSVVIGSFRSTVFWYESGPDEERLGWACASLGR